MEKHVKAKCTTGSEPASATLGVSDDPDSHTAPQQTLTNEPTDVPRTPPGAVPRSTTPRSAAPHRASKSLKILDASSGFGFDELVDLEIPSTIPGISGDDELFPFPQTSNRAPEPGQRVGRYLTEAILGKGGMGLVLKARDDLLQREVAVKVILPQYLSSDPAAGLRFLREAEIVARLEHPHIIRVLDAGLDSGIAFLAFEYVHGTSFSELRDRGLSGYTEAIDLLIPVISALAYAHGLGVVHGDLKPTNLLLGTDYCGRPHPWVLDFGVSFFSNVEVGLDPTRRRVTGTPGYIAPEWMLKEGVDGRADCFSLGCVLYEMLAGKPPFAGIVRLSQAEAAARARDYPKLSDVCDVPQELQLAIEKALEPEPDTRYHGALEMGRALLAFASDPVRAFYEKEFSAPTKR